MSFEDSFESQAKNNLPVNETNAEKNLDLGRDAEANKIKKDIFIDVLNEELLTLEKSGRISLEQAEGKRKSAALVETGFSDNPKNDALLFSIAGIAGEEELIDIFNKNKLKEKDNKDNKEASDNLKIKEKRKEVKEKEISEEELIKFLENREPRDTEAVEYLRRWIDQEHKKVVPNPKDQLNFNLHWAQMYEKAGWVGAAREAYEDVKIQAYQQSDDEVLKIAEEALNELS